MDPKPKTEWTTSKWTLSELDDKTVEFFLPIQGGSLHGTGKFLVRKNAEGLLAIEVITDEPGRSWAERIQRRFHLSQGGADRIVKNPDQTKAEFLLK